MTYLLFVVGLLFLLVGAEGLVRGASRIATAMGVSPLIVGLTVVAFGTSAPEFAVGLAGVLAGSTDITVGNVVGSNILNILLILGLAALLTPLAVPRQMVRREVPVMVGATLVAALMASNGLVEPVEGVTLFGALIILVSLSIQQARRERVPVVRATGESGARTLMVHGAMTLAGLGLLILGAHWMVDSAVDIAREFGVDELVVSLVVVSLGTSLPEVATTVVAGIKGERDLAVGNIVGSNLFNVLGVLGLSAAVSGPGLPVQSMTLQVDLPVMVGAALICLPIFFTGQRVSRGEGVFLLVGYVVYTGYLVLRAMG
jgi:cation:H+ antiporter